MIWSTHLHCAAVDIPPAVAAKNDAMASTPSQGPFKTEASRTGLAAKAAANSFVPFFLTIALQPAPGGRAKLSWDIAFPRNSESKSGQQRGARSKKIKALCCRLQDQACYLWRE